MRFMRAARDAFLALGVIGLLIGVGLLIRAVTGPTQGLEDLGFVVGFMMMVAVSSIAFGASLLAASATDERTPRWRLAATAAGALLGVVVAVGMGTVALESTNVPLLVFVGIVVAVVLAGLAATAGMWRSPQRVTT